MTRVVLDTNVLVSALWKHGGNPFQILDLLALRQLTPCFTAEILTEYRGVLSRDRFLFLPSDIENLLNLIHKEGIAVITTPSTIPFIDEHDRVFYDTAKAVDAYLVT
jgi:putative PIN family toxin of toxin-antitoxin system